MPESSLLLQMTAAITDDFMKIPDTAGVYVIFWIQADVGGRCPLNEDALDADGVELVPLYIGASNDSLRVRIKRHVLGDTRSSTLRASLGLILANRLHLKVVPIPTKTYFCVEPERRLSDWIVSNTVVGYFETDDPFGLEKTMLASSAGKLNISGRRPNETSRRLKLLRSNASGRKLHLNR